MGDKTAGMRLERTWLVKRLLHLHFFIFPNGCAEFLLDVADTETKVSEGVYDGAVVRMTNKRTGRSVVRLVGGSRRA